MTRSDFETHWVEHIGAEISPAKQAEARIFLNSLIIRMRESVGPLRILDAGCGDGVHAVVLSKAGLNPHFYYGIDLSLNAARSALRRVHAINKNGVEYQVGNVLTLPYRSHSFDVVFSYGVIAYTGSLYAALDEIVRVCKPGGEIGIWLYPKTRGVTGALFEFTRLVCRMLGKRLSKYIVYMIVPLLPILPVRSGVNLFNSTWQQCVEVVEVNLLPEILEFCTLEEIMTWFRERQMEVLFTDPERPITMWVRT